MSEPISNPFATRFVAPGNLAWVPPGPQADLGTLQRRLKSLDYRAAIVGPHGTGKSTLLEHLVGPIGPVVLRLDHHGEIVRQSASHEMPGTVWLVLRRGRKQNFGRSTWRPGGLLVLDGYEQLSYPERCWIVLETRLRRMGLLVTSHRPVCLSTLVTTSVSAGAMRLVVRQAAVQAGVAFDALPEVGEGRLEALLKHHGGNAREAMMQLYDEFAASKNNWSGSKIGQAFQSCE
ncbi:MAG: hypothetical protein Aurels2KO_20010 [Aureliella sp.]